MASEPPEPSTSSPLTSPSTVTSHSNGTSNCDSFEILNLTAQLLSGIRNRGFMHPTEVQQLAFVPCTTGRDVFLESKPGCGKTTICCIAALSTIDCKDPSLQVLIITSEQAEATRIQKEITGLSSQMKVSTYLCFGGPKIDAKNLGGFNPCQILIGTLGRVSDLIRKKIINTNCVRLLVLDRIDQIMDAQRRDNHCKKDIKFLVEKSGGGDAQKILVAVDLTTDSVGKFVTKLLKEPVLIECNSD